jgi:aldehyde dehydrogenase (NAD+)
LVKSDLFAPWVAVMECVDESAMLSADASCPYRLGASIFGPVGAARRLAEGVGAANVTINDVIVPTADPRLPFGAAGGSGYGVTRGPEGLLAMTRPVVVSVRRGGVPRHYDLDTPGLEAVVRAAIGVSHGATAGERWRAGGELARAIGRLGRGNRSPGGDADAGEH